MSDPVLPPKPTILPAHAKAERKRKPSVRADAQKVANRTNHKREPWDRQDGETMESYENFCLFRDAGASRSVVSLVRAGRAGVEKQSSRHQWYARAIAYDEYMEKRTRLILERRKLELASRQSRLGGRMQDVAAMALGLDPVTGEVGNTALDMIQPESIRDVVALAEAGSRIERLALGEHTEKVDTEIKFQYSGPLPQWAPKALTEGEGAVIEGEFSPSPEAEESEQPSSGGDEASVPQPKSSVFV